MQIDVYGELMDMLYHTRHGQLGGNEEDWALQRGLLDHLEAIWEEARCRHLGSARRPPRFTNSKVMARVAFDRGVKTIEQFKLDGPLDHWRASCSQIHDEVCRYGFNPEIGASNPAPLS